MLDSENAYIQLAAVPALAASAKTGDADLMALFARRFFFITLKPRLE